MRNLTFESLVNAHGEYTKDGEEYAISRLPYVTYCAGSSNGYMASGESYYIAPGYDRSGSPVDLIWDIVRPDAEESEACDWDLFSVRPADRERAAWAEQSL